MGTVTFEQLLIQLGEAHTPEAVFGQEVLSAEQLKAIYRHFVTIIHPDRNPQAQQSATWGFQLLQKWYTIACDKEAKGVYGRPVLIEINSPDHRYVGYTPPIVGDLADIFVAYMDEDGEKVVLKLLRHPRDNDLGEREGRELQRIGRELVGNPLIAHFPQLIETFILRDAEGKERHCNVLRYEEGARSLSEVIGRYPHGLHPADMAWMFNRTLAILDITHNLGLVHGAVLPPHLWIRPSDHNGLLLDWCYNTFIGQPLTTIVPAYKAYYPPEVEQNLPATAATDLYMAANTILALLGGDVTRQTLPQSTPKAITALLRSCLLPSPHRRMQSAQELHTVFRELLERLYGPPHFRPFSL